MRFGIVISSKDPAGMNIRSHLLDMRDFVQKGTYMDSPVLVSGDMSLYTVSCSSVDADGIDKDTGDDLYIFATKHESASKIPSLCVHTPGNWGKAEMGGEDRTLCIAPTDYLRKGLFLLKGYAVNSAYQAIQECTHHGPSLKRPCMFIEIGSDLEHWKDPWAGKVIAETIINITTERPERRESAFGIGGLHHTPQFTRFMEKDDRFAFGHICPKYMLDCLDEQMIRKAIECQIPDSGKVFIEWKGLGRSKARILEMLNSMKIDYIRV